MAFLVGRNTFTVKSTFLGVALFLSSKKCLESHCRLFWGLISSHYVLYTIIMELKEKILRDLRKAIVRREYRPGEHLKEAVLCERFKVSRTPIREALNRLEKEGFIKITPGVGAKVIQLSDKEVLDIYDILITLEGAASRLACTVISNEQIAKLEEYNFLFEKAMDSKNVELLFELNDRFHWVITEATTNSYLIDMRTNFRRLIDPIARIFPTIPGQPQASSSQHKQIIGAFKAKNPALAEFLMREHLEAAKKNLAKYLQEKDEAQTDLLI